MKKNSEFYKRAGDVARSRASDHVAINGRCEEATWQPVERPIARQIRAVDLKLSEGGTWRDLIHQIMF